MQHSLFYDWKHHLKLFRLGGAVNPWEEEGEQISQLNSTEFVEEPGSAKHKQVLGSPSASPPPPTPHLLETAMFPVCPQQFRPLYADLAWGKSQHRPPTLQCTQSTLHFILRAHNTAATLQPTHYTLCLAMSQNLHRLVLNVERMLCLVCTL